MSFWLMEKRALIVLFSIIAATFLFYIMTWLYYVVSLALLRKKDPNKNEINVESHVYQVATTFKFQVRRPFKYKFWWTSLADVPVFASVCLYAIVLMLAMPSLTILALVLLPILVLIIVVIVNIVMYMKLARQCLNLETQLVKLDNTCRKYSTTSEAIKKHLLTKIQTRSKEESLSGQDLREIFIEALNMVPRQGKSKLREYLTQLHAAFFTCNIVYNLYQLPPKYRMAAVQTYLKQNSIRAYVYRVQNNFTQLSFMSYIADPMCRVPKNLFKSTQSDTKVTLQMAELNAAIPKQLFYIQVRNAHMEYIKGQMIARTILFAALLSPLVPLFYSKKINPTSK